MAGGYDDNIGGFIGADVRLEGPVDMDQTQALVVGNVYVLALGIEPLGPTEFTLTVRIADIEVTNNAEDEPMQVVNAVSKGSFTPDVMALAAAAAREKGGPGSVPAGTG